MCHWPNIHTFTHSRILVEVPMQHGKPSACTVWTMCHWPHTYTRSVERPTIDKMRKTSFREKSLVKLAAGDYGVHQMGGPWNGWPLRLVALEIGGPWDWWPLRWVALEMGGPWDWWPLTKQQETSRSVYAPRRMGFRIGMQTAPTWKVHYLDGTYIYVSAGGS